MTPNENNAQFSNAPPLNRLNNAATLPPACRFISVANQDFKTEASMPGQEIADPTRTTISSSRVNRIRFRSSGILNVLEKAEIM